MKKILPGILIFAVFAAMVLAADGEDDPIVSESQTIEWAVSVPAMTVSVTDTLTLRLFLTTETMDIGGCFETALDYLDGHSLFVLVVIADRFRTAVDSFGQVDQDIHRSPALAGRRRNQGSFSLVKAGQ